ncbi:uncharacterized protein [Oscarella lobularis]|uniref:uncharacterized protein isoform X4 n=1 Tax=Oscarella lobularis TaxID=121494 RepID=UPI003313B54E
MRGALGPLGTQTPTRLYGHAIEFSLASLRHSHLVRSVKTCWLPISLVLPLQLLFIITCAAVTQGKVAIQSSPTLSGYPITVSCIKGQANGENSPPSVTWIMNGLAIDFWATKYDRFSSSVVSAGSTTLYHLTIDPSDRGDNNATVSCQLQGYPPSEETRLVIYDSIPTVVANGDGNVTVEEDKLFRHSFRINFDFQGTIAVAYYQNTQIVGKEEILYIDGRVNVSLPGFRIVPANGGILNVRIVVSGLYFIVPVFNLTVVRQRSLAKLSASPTTIPPTVRPTAFSTTVPPAVPPAVPLTASPTVPPTSHDATTWASSTQATTLNSMATNTDDGTVASSSESVTEPFLASDVPVSVILPCILIPAFVIGLFLLICCKPCKPCKPCIEALQEKVRIKKRNASSSTVTEGTVQNPLSTPENENGPIYNRIGYNRTEKMVVGIDYNHIERMMQSTESEMKMKVEETEIALAEKIDGQKISEQPKQGGNEGNLAKRGTLV